MERRFTAISPQMSATLKQQMSPELSVGHTIRD